MDIDIKEVEKEYLKAQVRINMELIVDLKTQNKWLESEYCEMEPDAIKKEKKESKQRIKALENKIKFTEILYTNKFGTDK